jgi:hypothetical protein
MRFIRSARAQPVFAGRMNRPSGLVRFYLLISRVIAGEWSPAKPMDVRKYLTAAAAAERNRLMVHCLDRRLVYTAGQSINAG